MYVGSGQSFAEVLAAVPLAGQSNSPILLVDGLNPQGRVPQSVYDELTRLSPKTVIVIGGSYVVADSVFSALKTAVPSASVERIDGNNKYEVASSIAERLSSKSTMYVATGEVFADALAISSIAVRNSSSILMVNPTGQIAIDVANALKKMSPKKIVIVGGKLAVSAEVERQIASYS